MARIDRIKGRLEQAERLNLERRSGGRRRRSIPLIRRYRRRNDLAVVYRYAAQK